jgi:SAM-dependent methyltransferase
MSHLDQSQVDAFANRMLDVLNGGALALMTSIGHRTGLFDHMAGLPPSTSARIAEVANLDERYVREWLGSMLTGGVVTYDEATATFALPAEHASVLTRSAAPDNMAAFTQYIGLLGTVEDRIVECFREGGGVPYGEFPRFQEVMAEDSGQTVVPALLDSILPLAPGLVERLRDGIDVLDIGCCVGRALNLMAKAFPNSRFTGYELLEQTVAQARAAANGCPNLRFARKDVAELDETESFDLITAFDAVHDQARPDRVLAGVHAALRPGGVFLMQDISGSSEVHRNVDHPIGTFLYTISCMHCMTVSLAEDGMGLGTMWGVETARKMLAEAGFGTVDVHELPHDFQNCYFVAAKG